MDKDERLYIYKEALKAYIDDLESLRDATTGMCYYIIEQVPFHYEIDYKNILDHFPELIEYKPVGLDSTDFWFSLTDINIRIRIFNEIIKSLEDE
jgi:hypothetical protein